METMQKWKAIFGIVLETNNIIADFFSEGEANQFYCIVWLVLHLVKPVNTN